MPSRFWVPMSGIAGPVQAEHLHAAISRLLDHGGAEHNSAKPYACSPMIPSQTGPAVVISTLTKDMAERLLQALDARPTLRLGAEVAVAGPAELLSEQRWADLACGEPSAEWRLDLLSPTMKRQHSRVSALPEPYSLCVGLMARWNRWGDVSHPHPVDGERFRRVLVTELELRSEAGTWGSVATTLAGRDYVLAGSRGSMRWLLPETDLAAAVSPLLRLAPYAGLGSYTARGFGYCRTTPLSRSRRGTPG